jgi:hypothetical protein
MLLSTQKNPERDPEQFGVWMFVGTPVNIPDDPARDVMYRMKKRNTE